jgi:hypothetical protein
MPLSDQAHVPDRPRSGNLAWRPAMGQNQKSGQFICYLYRSSLAAIYRRRNEHILLAEGAAMPRYYFDVDDGENQDLDIDGVELSDENTARAEAISDLYALAREMLPQAGRWQIALSVRDEGGTVVIEEALLVTVKRLKLS